MDGMRYDFPSRSDRGGFSIMEQEGIKAVSLIPVYQSSTYPAHVSMATGVYPDKHGILHNGFWDKQKGKFSYSPDADWIETPPIWVLAEQQGIKSATFFWVGSETNWNGTSLSFSKEPFDGKISESQKIEQILNWIDLPKNERPQLIMTWWHGADSMSHKHGPNHENVTDQIRDQDQLLLKLINSLKQRDAFINTTLIVVSDHGMSEVSNVINLTELVDKLKIKGKLSVGPAVGHLFLEDLSQKEKAAELINDELLLNAYTKKNLPSDFHMLHDQRTGDIVMTTQAPNMLSNRTSNNPPKGMHGYNPDINLEMEGVFFAMGNGVSRKKMDKFQQIDLAPTIANLLNINMPKNIDGKSISLD